MAEDVDVRIRPADSLAAFIWVDDATCIAVGFSHKDNPNGKRWSGHCVSRISIWVRFSEAIQSITFYIKGDIS